MSGAVNVSVSLGSDCENVHVPARTPTPSPNVVIITPLERFMSSARNIRAGHDFVGMSIKCRKDFYDRVADSIIKDRSGGLTYMNAADRVAAAFGIRIAKLDRQRLKTSICNRVHGRRIFLQQYDDVSPIKVEPTVQAVEPLEKKSHRTCKCGRKRKDIGDVMPSNKLKKAFKGDARHLEY